MYYCILRWYLWKLIVCKQSQHNQWFELEWPQPRYTIVARHIHPRSSLALLYRDGNVGWLCHRVCVTQGQSWLTRRTPSISSLFSTQKSEWVNPISPYSNGCTNPDFVQDLLYNAWSIDKTINLMPFFTYTVMGSLHPFGVGAVTFGLPSPLGVASSNLGIDRY